MTLAVDSCTSNHSREACGELQGSGKRHRPLEGGKCHHTAGDQVAADANGDAQPLILSCSVLQRQTDAQWGGHVRRPHLHHPCNSGKTLFSLSWVLGKSCRFCSTSCGVHFSFLHAGAAGQPPPCPLIPHAGLRIPAGRQSYKTMRSLWSSKYLIRCLLHRSCLAGCKIYSNGQSPV